MTDAPIQSPHYVLIVDEKANAVLGCMLQAAALNASIFQLLLMAARVSKEELASFVDDMAKKEHVLGWCTDPNCKEKKP